MLSCAAGSKQPLCFQRAKTSCNYAPNVTGVRFVPKIKLLHIGHSVGRVNLEKLYIVARHYGISKQYLNLTSG